MKNLLLALLLLSAYVEAEMYKCPSAGGTSYQEKPCAKGGQKVEVDTPSDGQERAKYNQLISVGRVGVGMTQDEVIRAWGRPTKVNRTMGRSYVSEQWVYERPVMSNNQYLYFDNGILRTIQTPGGE